MNKVEDKAKYEDEEEDSFPEETVIRWSNLLFLPFNPVFRFIVLLSVIAKSIFGPLQMVYPLVYCWDVLDSNLFLWIIKVFYVYACDPIYGIDTFLHIMHRQVTEEAMRREFIPKSAFLLFIDILCLIPFLRLMVPNVCTNVAFWPNVMSAVEFLTVYRIAEYFSLHTTHDFLKLLFGFTLIYVSTINCISSFFLLLTYIGLCENCTNEPPFKDWRKFIVHKIDQPDEIYSTYIFGASFIFSFPLNIVVEEIKVTTLLEYIFFSSLMIFFYLVHTFIIIPKMVAEVLLLLKHIFTFYPRVKLIIAETQRRNPSTQAHIDVKNFYALMWKQHDGVTRIPHIISEFPRYLRIEIKQDLVWPVFYHSPTLRKTSNPYQKWLYDYIHLEFKLPGSRFFVGPQCQTHLYYIKAGIVQLISNDDGITPIISVTAGTIFGDVSFFAPPSKRKVMVRCLTYCEVLLISREDILKSLHKFPDDRKSILQRARDKIKHAHTLYMCKTHVRGLDRAEDEGIAWIKRRWWEVSETVSQWNSKDGLNIVCFELSGDDTIYHCVKYIGQLVLCTDTQLHRDSLFVNFNFPLILMPDSVLCATWQKIVCYTVFLVLFIYPPNLTRPNDVPIWFNLFQIWVNSVYILDIFVSLITPMKVQEKVRVDFASIMLARFKSLQFLIDLISTVWLESWMVLIGLSQYYYVSQFNRLLKIYVLFPNWTFGKDATLHIFFKVCLIHVTFAYVLSYITFCIIQFIPNLSVSNFFGEIFCKMETEKTTCNFKEVQMYEVFVSWLLEYLFSEYQPQNLKDIYGTVLITYIGFLIFVYCKASLIGIFHAHNTGISNYQYFVNNVTKHYKQLHIHPDLLKRLNRYLMCHWKHFRGMDVMLPNLLKDEPYDIYWRVHGEIAENIIGASRAFLFADRALIKEIAYHAKFILLPQNSTVIVFGLRPKNVTWLAQGYIKCEFHDEKAKLVRSFYNPGEALAFTSVLFDQPVFRTFVAYTECEVLYLSRKSFLKILSHYPNEMERFRYCMNQFKPKFEQYIQEHIRKYKDYQSKLRKQIFHARASIIKPTRKNQFKNNTLGNSISYDTELDLKPSSKFFRYWTVFRAFVVCISIITAALQGGAGANSRWYLMIIGSVCDTTTIADIILKCFRSYYNKRGLLITDFKACLKYYLTHNFLLDIIGVLPANEIYEMVTSEILEEDDALILNTVCRFAHLYIVIGFFDYWADKPTANIAYIMILKWQVISILLLIAASQFLIKQCIKFNWGQKGDLMNATLISTCWLPTYMNMVPENSVLNYENITLIFAQSLNVAQSGLLRIDLGTFNIRNRIATAVVLLMLGCSFWYVLCYILTLLVLNSRVNTLFQQGVFQLQRFLEDERVDENLIKSVQENFKYVWLRTKGISIQKLINEHIGVVFRQDLSHYFLKTTISSLNTLLQGGEQTEKQLAMAATEVHFLPDREIVREMDLCPSVFIIHRGKILITKNGEKLTTLAKGAIFGQLDGVKPRPVRISAKAEGYADVLEIPIAEFQEALNDEVRQNIEGNAQSKLDFLALKKTVIENPYNTIQYILRGKKTIKLPNMKTYMEASNNSWYSKWLFLVWLVEPMITSAIVLALETVPEEIYFHLYLILIILDIIHLLYIISEFFTMELAVVDEKCVMRILKYRIFLDWTCYLNLTTIVIPIATIETENWMYQLVRLFRLRLFYKFYGYFCTGFQSRVASILVKFLTVVMMLHAMTCGWMLFACRDKEFPIKIRSIPPFVNASIDHSEWMHPNDRNGGCARITMPFKDGDKQVFSFVVPKTWSADYIVSITYILVLYTQTEMDSVLTLNLKQIYYKIFINFVIHLLDIWILSTAISAVYAKFHELYQYDYNVRKLLKYLKHTGLSSALLKIIQNYTKHLWIRQTGNWLPELAHNAPQCLREDIFGALYLYHLKTPPLLRDLPDYFLRQLVTRLCRVVIFPGKSIVQEGDIYSCIYFIHEGEVEKWGTDKSGDLKMLSLLSTNNYFGFIPGLFPNSPFTHTYVTRTLRPNVASSFCLTRTVTPHSQCGSSLLDLVERLNTWQRYIYAIYSNRVVDLVFLKYKRWQDLLQGYPKVKYDLYTAAMQLKKEVGSN